MHSHKKVIPSINLLLFPSGQMSAGRETQDDSEVMSTINSKSTGKIGLHQPNDPQDVDFYNSDSSADAAQAAKVAPTVSFHTDILCKIPVSFS